MQQISRGVWRIGTFHEGRQRPEGQQVGHDPLPPPSSQGLHRRTSEAIVGTKDGVYRAGTIRSVGAHRRWDATGSVMS